MDNRSNSSKVPVAFAKARRSRSRSTPSGRFISKTGSRPKGKHPRFESAASASSAIPASKTRWPTWIFSLIDAPYPLQSIPHGVIRDPVGGGVIGWTRFPRKSTASDFCLAARDEEA